MKVSDYKKMGLDDFLEDDVFVNDFAGVCDASASIGAGYGGGLTITYFAWRENTGVKPEFMGLVDVLVGDDKNSEQFHCINSSDLAWDANPLSRVVKWRPSLNQPSVIEPDTKQSAIHKAFVELKGDLSSVISIADDEDDKLIISVTGGHYSFGSITKSNDRWEIVCTVKEFTDYCEKMAAEEKRMDIIGQNGNDGLHYGKTAQQVEALFADGMPKNMKFAPITGVKTKQFKSDDNPIFTQAMADAGELPPVGYKLKFTHDIDGDFKCFHSERYGWEHGDNLEVIHAIDDYRGDPAVIVLNAQPDVLTTAVISNSRFFDTRTDREKAIDATYTMVYANKIAPVNEGAITAVIGDIYDAGLLKC